MRRLAALLTLAAVSAVVYLPFVIGPAPSMGPIYTSLRPHASHSVHWPKDRHKR